MTCSCGSKVYFEKLGEPWPLHECQLSLPGEPIRIKIQTNPQDLSKLKEWLKQSERIRSCQRRLANLGSHRNVQPTEGEHHIGEGVVAGVECNLIISEEIRFYGNQGNLVLNKLRDREVARLMVVTEDRPEYFRNSYEFFILQDEIEGPDILEGAKANFEIQALVFSNYHNPIWVASSLRLSY